MHSFQLGTSLRQASNSYALFQRINELTYVRSFTRIFHYLCVIRTIAIANSTKRVEKLLKLFLDWAYVLARFLLQIRAGFDQIHFK